MRCLRLAAAAFCVLFLSASMSPQARADQWNQKTIFTFSAPVEVPGFHGPMVLPAGTYVFKLMNSLSDRNIVQIFNKDESHLYSTILAIPDYRMRPTGTTVIKFEERAAGSPEAVKAWFYPGDNFGQEFVYPKPRALELAKATNEPVLSMPATTTEKTMANAPIKAEEPSGQEEESSAVVGTKPEPTKTVAQNLPKTASDMPLAALGGMLLIGLGVGLGLLSRKFA